MAKPPLEHQQYLGATATNKAPLSSIATFTFGIVLVMRFTLSIPMVYYYVELKKYYDMRCESNKSTLHKYHAAARQKTSPTPVLSDLGEASSSPLRRRSEINYAKQDLTYEGVYHYNRFYI